MRTQEQIDKYLEIEKKYKADDNLDIICGMTGEVEKILGIKAYMSADMGKSNSSRVVKDDFFLLRPFKKSKYNKKATEFFDKYGRNTEIEAVGEFFHNVDLDIFNKGYCYRYSLVSKCGNYHVVCYFSKESIYDSKLV